MTTPPDPTATRSPDEVWSGVLAMLVHDLRTPLSSVILNLELLVQPIEGLGIEQREDIGYALASARGLAEMLRGVSDLAHLTAGTRRVDVGPVDFSALVTDAASVEPTPGDDLPEVLLDVAPGVMVTCDAEMTARVVRGMLGQARAVTRGRPVRATVSMKGDRVRLEVTDDGAQLPEAFRERVFTLEGATALREHQRSASRGLAPPVWRLVARAQGGEAGAEWSSRDAADRGNTFWLELPAPGRPS